MQIQFLENRAKRYLKLSEMARDTLNNLERGIAMDNEEMFKAFDYEKMTEEQKQYAKNLSTYTALLYC